VPEIAFIVEGVPVPQPRQRHRVLQTANGPQVQNYTPSRHPVQAFKQHCQLAARQAHQGPPLAGPVVLSLVFVLPRPQAMQWKSRPTPRVPHVGRPDLDNLMKSIADSLKGLVWADDAQVTRVEMSKWYASGDEQPHVRVRVSG